MDKKRCTLIQAYHSVSLIVSFDCPVCLHVISIFKLTCDLGWNRRQCNNYDCFKVE